MSIKKYENKKNVVYNIIKKSRENKNLTKIDVCKQLQLYAVYLDHTELYRIEACQRPVKDFELIALCDILDIDFKELKNAINSYKN